MANAIDRAVRAQGACVVKPHQVRAMIHAARRAYVAQSKLGLVDYGVDFDAWRCAALHDVTGPGAPDSFRAVTQRDYAAVVEYFLELAGGKAERSSAIKSGDEVRRALWALAFAERDSAGVFGGAEGVRRYVDALFARIHATDRAHATAKQVWAVIFTLRNRAAKKRARMAQEASAAADAPLPPPDGSGRFPAFSRGL